MIRVLVADDQPMARERLVREVVGFVRLAEALAPVCARVESPEAQRRQREILDALEDESELQPPV